MTKEKRKKLTAREKRIADRAYFIGSQDTYAVMKYKRHKISRCEPKRLYQICAVFAMRAAMKERKYERR